MASTAVAALAVTDELALPLRAVGDLAAAAGVSREEVVVITHCTSLGNTPPPKPLTTFVPTPSRDLDRSAESPACMYHM